MPKAAIGKRNHRDLTISLRNELADMAEIFGRLIDEVRRLEKSSAKNTNEISLSISELVHRLDAATRNANAIWDLITGAEPEGDEIERQLFAVQQRLDEHDQLIRWMQQLLSRQEQAEQLYGETEK